MAPRLNLIVAVCENMGIGVNGNLPWKLKSELAFFKRMTLETSDASKTNMVIMGRRTWESIPAKFRPLPGRVNVVLSSKPRTSDFPQDVEVYSSLEALVKELQEGPLAERIETAWIIGGSSVYRQALESKFCHRVYLTKIHKDYECDTFLDPINEAHFQTVSDPNVPSDVQEENGTTFKYLVYESKMNSISGRDHS